MQDQRSVIKEMQRLSIIDQEWQAKSEEHDFKDTGKKISARCVYKPEENFQDANEESGAEVFEPDLV